MDPKLLHADQEHPEILVGVKTAHYEGLNWDPVDRCRAGRLADVPVMVDFQIARAAYQDLVLKHCDRAISTHMYLGRVPMLDKKEGSCLSVRSPTARDHF
jgi:dihydroorotase